MRLGDILASIFYPVPLAVFLVVSPYFLYQAIRYKKYIGTLRQRLQKVDSYDPVRLLEHFPRPGRLSAWFEVGTSDRGVRLHDRLDAGAHFFVDPAGDDLAQ